MNVAHYSTYNSMRARSGIMRATTISACPVPERIRELILHLWMEASTTSRVILPKWYKVLTSQLCRVWISLRQNHIEQTPASWPCPCVLQPSFHDSNISPTKKQVSLLKLLIMHGEKKLWEHTDIRSAKSQYWNYLSIVEGEHIVAHATGHRSWNHPLRRLRMSGPSSTNIVLSVLHGFTLGPSDIILRSPLAQRTHKNSIELHHSCLSYPAIQLSSHPLSFAVKCQCHVRHCALLDMAMLSCWDWGNCIMLGVST